MDQETLKLLIDLHIHHTRQGPGSEKAFQHMLALSGIDTESELEIADIGSGTGSSTIPLLQTTNAKVTAVELFPAFLEELTKRAGNAGVQNRVRTLEADMGSLPFGPEQFDVMWSEGAIYNIGFKKGIVDWKQFLKLGGLLVVSEITWLRQDIPKPLKEHWEHEYPEIDTASHKIAQLESNGYAPIGYFPLSPECWLENYYEPLQESFAGFLERHNNSDAAKEIVTSTKKEIELYKQYKEYVSYGAYIVRKVA